VGYLLTIHGLVRWLVAIIALVAIVRSLMGLVQKQTYTSRDRSLISVYTIVMDINLLLGLILLFGLGGGFPMDRIEHATTMIIAIVVAHSTAAWRKSDDSAKKFRNNLIAVVVSLVLVVMAVIRLRAGWTF